MYDVCIFSTAIRVMHLEAVQTNCVFFRGNLVRIDEYYVCQHVQFIVYKSHLYPLVEFPTYICLLIVCVWYAYKTIVSAYEMYQWCVNGKLVSHTLSD